MPKLFPSRTCRFYRKMAMKTVKFLLLFSMGCVLLPSCWSESIWHCSKIPSDEPLQSAVAQQDQFSIASLGGNSEVIGVSIRDLIDAYSGTVVNLGGVPLSACFWAGEEKLTASALQSLGLQPSAAMSLTRKSAIIQNNIHIVTSQSQMLQCIADKYPAVGYLPSSKETNKVSPCF